MTTEWPSLPTISGMPGIHLAAWLVQGPMASTTTSAARSSPSTLTPACHKNFGDSELQSRQSILLWTHMPLRILMATSLKQDQNVHIQMQCIDRASNLGMALESTFPCECCCGRLWTCNAIAIEPEAIHNPYSDTCSLVLGRIQQGFSESLRVHLGCGAFICKLLHCVGIYFTQ